MADIKLDSKGDLQLIKLTKGNNIVNDVPLETNIVNLLLKRALLSPFGHLTITELIEGTLLLKDNEYGNRIYEELSEGLTINFLSRVRSHTIQAIQNANLSTSVDTVDVTIIGAHTIQILVQYTNGKNNIIELTV